MALMYPQSGPVKETTSDAERQLFGILQTGLSDDYAVYHAVPWHAKDGARDGEVDFIVIHPEYGFVLLEVKGGGIQYNSAEHTWFSVDRHHVQHPISDPFLQVRTSLRAIKGHLERSPLTKSFAGRCRFGYAVWFPSIRWPQDAVLAPHMDANLILDSHDVAFPDAGLQRIFSHFDQLEGQKHYNPLSEGKLDLIEQVLAPTLNITSNLSTLIDSETTQIQRLTNDQMQRLDELGRYRRLAIRGAAGNGKTVLALEKARRLAAGGDDVLLLCSTDFLAAWLKRQVDGEPQEVKQHLFVYGLKDLCVRLAMDAGQPHALNTTRNQAQMAHQMNQCIRILRARGAMFCFDAILVDEAQDIDRPLWPYLQQLLKDSKNGLFYIFYDPAQREIDEEWSLPPGINATANPVLTINCRNTQTIFGCAMRFYTGLDQPICNGPEGRDPWPFNPANYAPTDSESDSELLALEAALDKLITEECIAPHDILIVTCASVRASKLADVKNRTLGAHTLTWHSDGSRKNEVAICSVRSAKGLEQKVVVLFELNAIEHEKKRDALLYVAISRARHHLVVVGTLNQLAPRQTVLLTADARTTRG